MSKSKTSKTSQAAATFSSSDHYTAKTGRMTEGREGWAYSGTLYRNGATIATFADYGDGGTMRVQWINGAEEAALRAWYVAVVPDGGTYYEDGLAIESIVMRSDHEARVRKAMLKKVVWCVPGDLRNGGKSTFYTTKPAAGCDVASTAQRVQQQHPEAMVLNLLPFDAGFALYVTLAAE
ncbi:hypothetical protein LGM58_20250 [Burkholderia contaminans]|uniref:hypothetical protein n=1 Tax=Burkholderia contaminans TaxID=488447 RepID=UPI001CF0F69E|nr:hypothetical protein [Burkholderia contaminans]MCA7885518.1 hypothetical protein [Burkholderia contaminans]